MKSAWLGVKRISGFAMADADADFTRSLLLGRFDRGDDLVVPELVVEFVRLHASPISAGATTTKAATTAGEAAPASPRTAATAAQKAARAACAPARPAALVTAAAVDDPALNAGDEEHDLQNHPQADQ